MSASTYSASSSTTLADVLRQRLATPPGQLWLRQAVIAVVTALMVVVAYGSYSFYAAVTKTVGRDSVPSIVAAQQIKTTLADAHTDIINVFLTQEKPNGPSLQAYRTSMNAAHDALLTASQNITYGDDERRPILAMMTNLAEYDRLVGRALASPAYQESLTQADKLMRETILPAASDLDQANLRHLDSSFAAADRVNWLWVIGVLLFVTAVGGTLIETKLKLLRDYRRMINPPIAAGLVVLVVAGLAFAITAISLGNNIRSAKRDAFDSVHALTQAQAVAYSANAEESLYLLAHGNSTEQARQTDLFNAAVALIYAPLANPSGNPKDYKGHGFLGDELANVTFAGEDKLAAAEFGSWNEYIDIDRQIRAREAAGDHAGAVALCLGTQPHQSDWAFEKFISDLKATTQLNSDHFAASMNAAYGEVSVLFWLVWVLALAPLVGSVVGLRMRLAEYRA